MLLIFDWDGTLIDSSAKIVRCMQQSAEDLQLNALSDNEVKNIIGLGLPEAIETLFPGIEEGLRDQFRDAYSKHYVEADQVPCEFFPGVMQTLETLHAEGYKLAVATGKSRRGLNRVLKNLALEEFFHGSRCADETRSKPHPLMLEELLDEFDRAPVEAVMVGDTSYDLEMAKNAGVPSVGVSYGAHHPETLAQYNPLGFIDEFPDLLAVLKKTDFEKQV